jgi:hypothetical protein
MLGKALDVLDVSGKMDVSQVSEERRLGRGPVGIEDAVSCHG